MNTTAKVTTAPAPSAREGSPTRTIEVKLLTTATVSEMLSVPEGTLRYWRKVGLGPSWLKLEGSIRYAEEDFCDTLNAIAELLPCGHTWRRRMLYRRGKTWHYDFTVAGRRQRGTTGQTSESRARKVESKLIEEAERRGPSAVLRRAPLLCDFAPRFLEWVDHARHLAPKSRRYYRVGWNQIRSTPLMGMNLDRITTEELDSLALAGSPSYVNQAFRTLRRLLGKAVEWKVIAVAPAVGLMKEVGGELTIDPETEAKLLAVARQPVKDVLIVIQDTGMRPDEVFRIRTENINWSQRLIFNPNGKTRAARRHVPISERMLQRLVVRCSDKREGWLFPSPRAKCGHLTTVAKQFREARSKAGLPQFLVLYCARHTFGTAAYGATGNLAMVMNVMGHSDVRTAMRYQHPVLDPVREAIDQRNLRHKPRHNELRVQRSGL